MTRVLFWLAVLAWAVVIWTSPGCMSHEQGMQMHREIREHEQRISDLEAVLGEKAPPEWMAGNGDGR